MRTMATGATENTASFSSVVRRPRAGSTHAPAQPIPARAPLRRTGAVFGVGAHLLDTQPGRVGGERTGVRGLPHRIGGRLPHGPAAVLLVGDG
ncbi:MAG TPA: hypothetical protein VFY14_04525 [Streptomyces sp.]|nr:hypothetical protein [Streptomyces sp.]